MLKFAEGGCASKGGLGGANHAQIRWNFAQSDCKSHQAPSPKSVKRRGLGGYADAKVRLRGLCLKRRAWGCKHAQIRWNFAQSDCKSCQAPSPKSVKRRGLGGYADAKLPAGDCASSVEFEDANHV